MVRVKLPGVRGALLTRTNKVFMFLSFEKKYLVSPSQAVTRCSGGLFDDSEIL